MPAIDCPRCRVFNEVSANQMGRWIACRECGFEFAALLDEPDDQAAPEQPPVPPARSPAMRHGVLISAAVVCTSLVVAFAASWWPRASSQGEDWTHRQLIDHLHKRGVQCHPCVAKGFDNPTVWLVKPEALKEDQISIADLMDPTNRMSGFQISKNWIGVIYVEKRSSAEGARQAAKDETGFAKLPSFSWGRFLFYGDARFIEEIRKAL